VKHAEDDSDLDEEDVQAIFGVSSGSEPVMEGQVTQPSTVSPSGWVLAGFPSSCAQAQLLVRALSGLDLLREVPNRSSRASPLCYAQAYNPPAHRVEQSGLDACIHVEEDPESLFLRIEGARADLQTHKAYHLEGVDYARQVRAHGMTAHHPRV
jgi:hypothetical protein